MAVAISDPLAVANNKIGIHILDAGEVSDAARLVNNEGKASWGYVTVPIQATDRNRIKWQAFMRRARELKVIPIVRVATVPLGGHWEVPNNFDLIDFANFLNDLDWPVKNRYVVIFNEVNHGLEYGGLISPEHYAQVLVNSVNVFKDRNEDFFVMGAAMDNGTMSNGRSMHWRQYLARMWRSQPEVFSRVDGWNSHAYPNPAFAGRVTDRHDHSVRSYLWDLNFLAAIGAAPKYIFITETGWDVTKMGEEKAAELMRRAYEEAWNDPRIVTVTPFLLMAGEGPFVPFSLKAPGGETKATYKAWQSLATVKGEPVLVEGIKEEFKAVTVKEAEESSDAQLWQFDTGSWETIIALLAGFLKMK